MKCAIHMGTYQTESFHVKAWKVYPVDDNQLVIDEHGIRLVITTQTIILDLP